MESLQRCPHLAVKLLDHVVIACSFPFHSYIICAPGKSYSRKFRPMKFKCYTNCSGTRRAHAVITPSACARGKAIPSVHRLSVVFLSVCRLSVCLSSAKTFSNILQADTSSTYNRVISFANSPILTFVYLIIWNTLQFSALSGLSYYPVQLVIHLEIPYIEL